MSKDSYKVAIVSYPMLFQSKGGLQIQVLETYKALKSINVEVVIFDYLSHKLSDFDIIHIFSANHGNYHIVQMAKENGCKVILSPLAEKSWTKSIAFNARLLEPFVGKLSSYLNYTFYSKSKTMFKACDHLIALGEGEKTALVEGFNCDENKVSVIKNGVPGRFFTHIKASENAISNRLPDSYILNVGTISNNKNQALLATLLAAHFPELKLVLVGEFKKSEDEFFKVQKMDNVIYLNSLDYESAELLAVYSNAKAFVLPSKQEVYPLSALEALATGVPALVTENSAMRFHCDNAEFQLIDPKDQNDIIKKLKIILDNPPSPIACRKIVEGFSWDQVANLINKIYLDVLSSKPK